MWVWAVWFAVVLAAFAGLEWRAKILNKPAVWPTLSRTIWHIQTQYPIFGFLLGLVVGGLAVHFFGFIPACRA